MLLRRAVIVVFVVRTVVAVAIAVVAVAVFVYGPSEDERFVTRFRYHSHFGLVNLS